MTNHQDSPEGASLVREQMLRQHGGPTHPERVGNCEHPLPAQIHYPEEERLSGWQDPGFYRRRDKAIFEQKLSPPQVSIQVPVTKICGICGMFVGKGE